MMSNIFSTFDPATSMGTSLNWMSSMIVLLMIPGMYWVIPSRYNMITKILYSKIHTEFKTIMGPGNWGSSIVFVALFMYILMNNLAGLMPYVFTSSAHMVFTLSLALPVWMSAMLFGWINRTQHMFAHMVPEGAMPALMPFLVCIETISNLIRPVSLSVRLMANMVAGHLFLCMLGNIIVNASNTLFCISMIVELLLVTYETAVAFIQAYVFFTLSALYMKEATTYDKT
uniref:ATP synthase subunit a n=1 Tax=Sycanus bifidus TaxID=452395 RepID=A0A7L8XKX9_9HEMI|nr:ATP synthase F0 subunit 6 [Sycanus croceovittatus]QOH97845.1 ATP synthase F0 subunit 6 [Sycanus croceovittatus]